MTRPHAPGPAASTSAGGAIESLERLLEAQRRALVDADLGALGTLHDRIHALITDPSWRRAAARDISMPRVRAALRQAAINAGVAARGEANAARALAALGVASALYTPTGALGAPAMRGKGRSA